VTLPKFSSGMARPDSRKSHRRQTTQMFRRI
jgi:hypothetical protein